jgi:hypothetical protein
MPSKCKALSSTLSAANKNKRKKYKWPTIYEKLFNIFIFFHQGNEIKTTFSSIFPVRMTIKKKQK